jgi:hypothetical protein
MHHAALYDTMFNSDYWGSASYLASTTGSLFSAIVQTAIEYHEEHKRYQPFSVYQVLITQYQTVIVVQACIYEKMMIYYVPTTKVEQLHVLHPIRRGHFTSQCQCMLKRL